MARVPGKKSVNDATKLNGAEKAAVVLLSLGEEHHQLWEALDDEEIKEISQAMSTLGNVTASVVEDLLVEFVSGMSSTGAIMGSFEQTQRLLGSFLPGEKVEGLMEEIRGPAGRTMWDKLGLALKGASDGLREMFFSNMSERAAKIMREDMESMGPVRLKDVDQAQMAMVQVAKDLAAKGEILLAGQGGDDELIY